MYFCARHKNRGKHNQHHYEHNYFLTFSTDLLAKYFAENLPAVAYLKLPKGSSQKVNCACKDNP